MVEAKAKVEKEAEVEWSFHEYREAPFKCALCGGRGKYQVVLKHKAGKEVSVGFTCLLYFGINPDDLPAHPRKAGKSGGTGDRWAKVKQIAGIDEWEVVEHKVEPFRCVCGGTGKNQVILKNTKTGETVAVGKSCMKRFNVKNSIVPIKASVKLTKSSRKAQPSEIAKALGLE